MGPAWALHRDLLQVGQHHIVSLGHCLELIKQKFQQLQQQPVEGDRESRKGKGEDETQGGMNAGGWRGKDIKRKRGKMERLR